MTVRILIGDCVQRMGELPDNSVDSVVCDPPYHLTSIVKRFGGANSAPVKVDRFRDDNGNDKGASPSSRSSKGFMGQTWDGGDVAFQPETWAEVLRVLKPGGHLIAFSGTRTYHRMAVAIEDAGFEVRDQLAWVYGSGFPKSHNLGDGWGTALKPSWEPIALCRKRLEGTSIANMAKHGVGGLNIDGCRVATDETLSGYHGRPPLQFGGDNHRPFHDREEHPRSAQNNLGRWPANLCHDGSDEAVAGFPDVHGAGAARDEPGGGSYEGGEGWGNIGIGQKGFRIGDSGSAARFFYCAKATTDERGEGNNHPTVKPVALMRWLVRLVTPKGGTVLDPFMGSGSTGLACDAEQFDFIGCELSGDYAEIARRRIADQAGMFADISVEMAGPATRAA